MIDHLDKKTQQLPLEQKRGRGRPATGQALSNAERQRRYREAQKAQRNENMHKEVAEDLRAELAKALKEIEGLKAKLRVEFKLGEKARSENINLALEVAQLKAQLEQRNEKPSRLNEGMQKIIRDVHEVADAIEGSTWRIQRKARANGKWVTLKGSYWNEAQAEDALADLPNKKGGWWRIVEVKSKVED